MTALLVAGCAGSLAAGAKGRVTAAAVGSACKRTPLRGCEDLGDAAGALVAQREADAERSVGAVVQANGGVVPAEIGTVLRLAADAAPDQREVLGKLARLLEKAAASSGAGQVQRPSGARVASHGAELPAWSKATAEEGCAHDGQCKGDRVCVDRRCIGPQLARAYEAKLIAAMESGTGAPPSLEATRAFAADAASGAAVDDPGEHREDRPQCAGGFEGCRLACEEGDGAACVAAASALTSWGNTPSLRDSQIRLYELGCRARNAEACALAAAHYLNGRGAQRNPARAAMALELACNLQDANACATLADMLSGGAGVRSDPQRAQLYRQRACDAGHEPACAASKKPAL